MGTRIVQPKCGILLFSLLLCAVRGISSTSTPSPTTYPPTRYQYYNLAQSVDVPPFRNVIAAGAKFVYQFDVAVAEQFVIFTFSSPSGTDMEIHLWKAYNISAMNGILVPFNTTSLTGLWNSTLVGAGDPGSALTSFILLKPNLPGVKDLCALSGTTRPSCTFFLEVVNKNSASSNNYTLTLLLGQILSFNPVADSAPSSLDPNHVPFFPLPLGLPYNNYISPNSVGVYAFDLYPNDLPVEVTFTPDQNTLISNCVFNVTITSEDNPFVGQSFQSSQAMPWTGFPQGLSIFLVQLQSTNNVVLPQYLQSQFQFSAVRNYNLESYFGLSMFGIVGALTVLVLCLFSAAAVIARRRRAADIRAYGTSMVGGVQMENRPPPGASEEQIRLLESQVFKKGTTITEEDAKCAVCLCDYEENDRLKMLPCKHHFHSACVTTWLKQRKHCPLCQQDIENAHDVKKPATDRPSSPPLSASGVQPAVIDGIPPHAVPDSTALDASLTVRSSSASNPAAPARSSLASSASSVAAIMDIPEAHLQHVRPSAGSVPQRVLPVNASHVAITVGPGGNSPRNSPRNSSPRNRAAVPIAAGAHS